MKTQIPSAEILKKYLANVGSEAEREMVNTWYSGLDLHTGDHFHDAEEDILLERIQMQISETESARSPKVLPFYRFCKYAASVAAMLILGFGLFYLLQKNERPEYSQISQTDSSWITYKNKKKRILRYQLPDSSVIWLNPYAQLSYPKSFTLNKTREIRFEGEGFFNVKPDKKHPFIIHTGAMQTTVLGTSFNVKANKNESVYEVSVVSGSVEVSTGKEGKTIILKPKQQVVFQKESNNLDVAATTDDTPGIENWEAVSLVFNETPMTVVAEKLQQTFKIKIEFANPDIEKCRLKIDFENQRLPEILEMIEMLLGTTYQMKNDKVVFGGEGCRSEHEGKRY
ncbi:FecR family protein [Dyadobacter sp. NIV53]|uniref:FecR family protein n=1 Tax=Dyadobacter sp. NIV53 TaxID=2861765 RepID=UPI001C88AA7F|nr:FecR family protein [Dyadobacter sp. NIV53]